MIDECVIGVNNEETICVANITLISQGLPWDNNTHEKLSSQNTKCEKEFIIEDKRCVKRV